MKAVITVTGIQNLENTGDDSIELVTDGVYMRIADGYAVKYLESELTGLAGTTTTVEVTSSGVVVERRGTLNMRMEFKEGCRTGFLYETLYGAATLGFETRRIVSELGDRGGSLSIDYVVNMEHAVVGINKLCMSVKPKETRQNI
ncbi:MAG: DUF1934 domain-containing protein [Oscillospiraceae bacterium]|mgnify:CR=1 FL=1|nr:DUF1934 domain-containing protein [Oscillospiraceae bacterium]